jgi:hypothetical protein
MRWVDKYNKNKNITRKNRIPKAYKIKKEEVDYILKILHDDNTITMICFKRLNKDTSTLILQADILVILLGIIILH